jgi:hypothetical protein
MTLLGGLAAWYVAGKGNIGKDWALILLASAGFIAGQVAFLGHDPWGKYIAGSAHIPAMKAELTKPDTPLYAVGRYEQALPFYLERTLTLVEFPDEMEFGLKQQPELWIPDRADFVARWRAHNQRGEAAVAIVRTDIYKEFQQQNLPMRVIGEDPRRVIIATIHP